MIIDTIFRSRRPSRLVQTRRRRNVRRNRTESRLESLESRLLLAAQIHGTVYHDVNADGIRQQDEGGLPNWTVFLDQNQNGALDAGEDSVQTDNEGDFQFTGLAAGDYRVVEIVRPDWTATNPATGYVDVTLADGDDLRVDFLNEGTAGSGIITGNVWTETSTTTQNHDPEDTPLSNWTVFLDLNGDGVLDPDEPFQLTDGDGNYMFTGVLGLRRMLISYEVAAVWP
ncbi:MAG: SdrD B-like domain-containing protein [Planctomycetaceae bacterium]